MFPGTVTPKSLLLSKCANFGVSIGDEQYKTNMTQYMLCHDRLGWEVICCMYHVGSRSAIV